MENPPSIWGMLQQSLLVWFPERIRYFRVFLGKKRIPNWGFGGFRPRKRFDKARRCPTPGRLPPSWRVPGVDRV